jgi:hypothetical protein
MHSAYGTLACALRSAKTLSLALVSAAGVLLGVASSANGAIYHSLADYNAGEGTSISISGAGGTIIDFLGATNTGTSDTPPSSLDATETFINANTTPSWNVDLTFQSPDIGGDVKSDTITDVASLVWVLKFDAAMIAVLFDTAVSSLTFSGLPAGLSHYDLGGVVPLPPAVLLFGTALVGMGLLGRRRKKALAQAI